MNITNILYYGFMVPFFIIGGGAVMLMSIEPIYVSIPAGFIGLCMGLFLILLDRKYDLD